MERRVQISVVGYNADTCTKTAYDAAYRVGKAVAKMGGVVVCGGLGGVMEAACKGARDAGGVSLGIVPSGDPGEANDYCDFVVATDMGHSRNLLVAHSGDAMVVVGGGAGTLIEAAAAYRDGKVVFAVKGTGGVADEYAEKFLDERKTRKVVGSSSPEDAVANAFASIKARGG